MQTFLINLDSRPDRMTLMRRQLERFDIPYERVSAIRGVDILNRAVPDEIADKFLVGSGFGSSLTPGEIGCYASHLAVYRAIRDRRLAYALVLEDDVILDPDVASVAVEAAHAAPDGWDVIKLCNPVRRSTIGVANVGSRHLVRFMKQPLLTGAYVISASGASKMLSPGLRVRPIDMEFRTAWEYGIEQYGIVPPPARDAGLPTSIEGRGAEQRTIYMIDRMRNREYVGERVPWAVRMKCRVFDALHMPRVVQCGTSQAHKNAALRSKAEVRTKGRPAPGGGQLSAGLTLVVRSRGK